VLAAEAAAAVLTRRDEELADLAVSVLLRAGLGLVTALDAPPPWRACPSCPAGRPGSPPR
jgi:hypothetical protein